MIPEDDAALPLPLFPCGVVEDGVAFDELALLLDPTPGMARRTMVGELSEDVVSGAELSMAAMPCEGFLLLLKFIQRNLASHAL